MKGTVAFPSSFIMTQETHIQTVEKLIGPLLQDDIFLVSIKIKPTNNIKIYLDADSGLGIEKCIKINRALYKIADPEHAADHHPTSQSSHGRPPLDVPDVRG